MFMLIFLLVCSFYATAMSGDDVNFDDMSRNELIAHYFGKGYQHKEIVYCNWSAWASFRIHRFGFNWL